MTALLTVLAILAILLFAERILYDRFWAKGLNCEIRFQSDCAAEGETATLQEVITNRKLLPLPVVEIDFHMDRRLHFTDAENTALSDRSYRRDVFALALNQRITRTLELRCAGRGYFEITEAGMMAHDLFLRKKYVGSTPQSTSFYVLPRPVPTELINIPFSRVMGTVLARKKVYDDPFEFAGLREYSRSDPMKYINWKATARAGKMLTNLHESTLSQRVILLLDLDGENLNHADRLSEAAIRIACSLTERLLRENIEVLLLTNGTDVQTNAPWKMAELSGAGSILTLRKRLACVQAGERLTDIFTLLPSGEQSSRDDLLVLVTAGANEGKLSQLAAHSGKERSVCVAPYETEHPELPAPSSVDFLWLEAK